MVAMLIQTTNFETVLPIWQNKLWVGRSSKIESHSAMRFLGGYDIGYFDNPATFLIALDNNQIVGCLSGHGTDPLWYRSRGLWVDQDFRRKGIAKLLMNKLFELAIEEGYKWIWTIPRITAMPFYSKLGYSRSSLDFDKDVEFGPNCYAAKLLC